MQMEAFNDVESGKQVMNKYRSAEEDWAYFCCFPDKLEPRKMPSLFPTPTHIVRRRIVKTIDVFSNPKLMYLPEYVYGQGALVALNSLGANHWGLNNKYRVVELNLEPPSVGLPGTITKVSGDWGPSHLTINQQHSTVLYDTTAPLTDEVANGGCRLIGACISIEYLGKVDNIEGIVEVGMNMNSQNTKLAAVPFSDTGFLTDDQMNQAPYYKRFRLSDGIRTIWFPMDESRFEFEEPMAVISKEEFDVNYPNVWDQKNHRTFIVPTKALQGSSTPGLFEQFPGASNFLDGGGNVIYKLENDNLHARARIEWGINFIGLTDTSKVRVYIDHFYETIPHEAHIDNFFPQKSPQGNSDTSTKIMHKVSQDVAVTSRSESALSIMGNV